MRGQDGIKVNTLIIGAGRSGTTTLYTYLKAHSDVCFSYIKEVPFFSIKEHYRKGEKYYHSFFRKCNSMPVIASADTYLLMDHDAISRIYAYNPEMKIIVMLRDPVSRDYSSYNYSVNFGHHDAYASFLDSVEVEKEITGESDIVKRNNVGHFYGSLYYEHLSKWTGEFPREQLLLLKTSDLSDDPQKFSNDLFSFLGIPDYKGEIERVNAAAVPKNKRMEELFMDRGNLPRRFIRKVTPRPLKNLIMRSGIVDKLHKANRREQSVVPLSKEDVKMAMQYFRDDLELLKREFHIEF
jgi:hypothetical protein